MASVRQPKSYSFHAIQTRWPPKPEIEITFERKEIATWFQQQNYTFQRGELNGKCATVENSHLRSFSVQATFLLPVLVALLSTSRG